MTHDPRPIARVLPLLGLLALLQAGCFTVSHYDTVYDQDLTSVRLREQTKGGSTIEHGFDHPTSISPIRLVYILSSIDVRTEKTKNKEDRRGAIPLPILYRIADGLAAGLEKANPNQEVVVQSIERRKETFIFDHFYLTSFLAWVKNDQLFLHLSHLDYEVELNKGRLPEPQADKTVMEFRVLPSQAITPIGPQAVVVDWRDPVFRTPSRIRTLPGGRVVRREILMESDLPDDSLPAPSPTAMPANLAPSTLRRLADLEERRRKGEINEAEYNAERREILLSDPATPR